MTTRYRLRVVANKTGDTVDQRYYDRHDRLPVAEVKHRLNRGCVKVIFEYEDLTNIWTKEDN